MLGILYEGYYGVSLEIVVYGNPNSPETWERARKKIEILNQENPDRVYWIEEVGAP